jgi:uncharacterized membrane protein YesL
MSVAFAVVSTAALIAGQYAGLALFRRLPGVLPPVATVLLALAAWAVGAGPLLAGVFRFTRNAAARREPEVFDLAWGFRAVPGGSMLLALSQLFGLLLLAANAFFYASQRHPALIALGALFGYAALFWTSAAFYQWPLLAEQEAPVRTLLKRSCLLVLDNAGYTALLLLLTALLTALLWLSVVGGILLWTGAMAMLLTQATRELLRKYRILPPDPTLDPVSGEEDA